MEEEEIVIRSVPEKTAGTDAGTSVAEEQPKPQKPETPQKPEKPQKPPKPTKPPKPPKQPKPPKEKKPADPAAKKKLAVAAACVLVAAAAVAFLMMPRGWKQEADGRCYYRMGSRVTGMQNIGGDTYWFDETGVMATGWQQIGADSYYFSEDGTMLKGTVTLEGTEYRFAEDGAFQYRVRNLQKQEFSAKESEEKAAFEKKNGAVQSWTYQLLNEPVENCTEFSARMKLTEYKSGNVEQWCFAYRDLNGQWNVLQENFGLTNDSAELEFTSAEPISFDAYIWYCQSIGTMWNFERSYDLTDVMVIEYEIES